MCKVCEAAKGFTESVLAVEAEKGPVTKAMYRKVAQNRWDELMRQIFVMEAQRLAVGFVAGAAFVGGLWLAGSY